MWSVAEMRCQDKKPMAEARVAQNEVEIESQVGLEIQQHLINAPVRMSVLVLAQDA